MAISVKKRKLKGEGFQSNTSAKTPRMTTRKFYAVHRGRRPGIYYTWPECKAQVDGFKFPVYKKFDTQAEAEYFVNTGKKETPPSKMVKTEEESSKTTASDTISTSEAERIVVYTDGSSRGNGKARCRAGVGVYFGENDPRNVSERLLGKQTNQRAEVTAAIRAIERVGDVEKPLEIRTDSQYLIKAITIWIHNWKKCDWKTSTGKGVENQDLFVELDRLISERQGSVQFVHVRAHIGIPGNENADMLANAGALLG